ncbi:hypothetical protein H4R18_005701 [Coemansia javaensis]|uniref:PUM-HD domain-containing protein n=1 Tax=Coemansia javaensis TaxID=2761396 RepID=A0A9W8LEY2_9FUNG|nr:hypothetical protein H4R18_005701 [Coemansia javaensis]
MAGPGRHFDPFGSDAPPSADSEAASCPGRPGAGQPPTPPEPSAAAPPATAAAGAALISPAAPAPAPAAAAAAGGAHRHTSIFEIGGEPFNESPAPPPRLGRAVGPATPALDTSNGLLDTMQSQQASPSAVPAQPGLGDFFVKSLPVSRRNSREFQNLWQELEGFSIGDGPAHMSAFDAPQPPASAPGSSAGALHAEAAGALGASPKLPHGLLDDDILPKQQPAAFGPPSAPATNGAPRSAGSGRLRIGSVADFAPPAVPALGPDPAHRQPVHPAFAPPPRPAQPADAPPVDAACDPRLFGPARAIGLTRNASTPALGAAHLQAAPHAHEDPAFAPPVPSTADAAAPLYGQYHHHHHHHHQYHQYHAAAASAAMAAANIPLYDVGALAYGGGTLAAVPGRSQSFIAGPHGGPAGAPAGPHGFGARAGRSHTSLQNALYFHSHVHMHTQNQPPVQTQLQARPQHSKLLASMPGAGGPQHQHKQQHQQPGQAHQKQQHGKAHRKPDAEANRFANVQLEELKGTIFEVCKDQHGCRYLQKKLEDGTEPHIDMIFAEVLPHFSLLMTDPFGNYLCQKLLEHCSEAQRTQIVTTVAPELVNVSLNMHGTRAVQKMIDSLSNQEQVTAIVNALRGHVVMLIRDLNGNHVIQKCLCRLPGTNNQFIYDSVAASCTDVATHRHGCCVFQRCIDHSTDAQKDQLVQVVIAQALALVQDPFGNYVVQYVLDLNVPEYSEPLITTFVDHICGLSVQKFSSNVMEKCIRMAAPHTRQLLVAPLTQRDRLEVLMRDSYGNYVVQTALDYAEPLQRAEIIETILPLLPLIRNTPYGKRIYNKLQRDGFVSAVPSAAGSRHASPTLGPSLAAHPAASMSSVALYPQMPHPAAGPPPAGLGYSRGASPSAAGPIGAAISSAMAAKPQAVQPRTYATNGAFQQYQPLQLQPHMAAPYYYMPPADAAAAAAVPAHPGGAPMAPPLHHGAIYEHAPGTLVSAAAAPTASAPPSSKAHVSVPAHHVSR